MAKRQQVRVVILVSVVLSFTSVFRAQEPVLSRERIRQFLLSADIIASEPIGRGITQPWRLTLSDGAVTHDAAFQSVDETVVVQHQGHALNLIDSYRHNIAAYQLAELIGLGHMFPVTVARTWNGTPGALSWWLDDVMFDEQTRLEQRRWPQDLESWGAQIDRMSLFAELVHDTDRHGGNVLYTSDWKLFMIDFTRAFSVTGELLWPYRLVRVDRQVFARLGVLTATEVGDATRPHLGEDEVEAVIQRRDKLVEHFRDLIEEKGEDAILY